MTQNTRERFPTSSFPKDHIVAVLDIFEEAEQAVQDLQHNGYQAEHIFLFHGQDFIAARKATEQESGLTKLMHIFQGTTDEGFTGSMYLEEAYQGHEILAVYEPHADQIERIRDVLDTHHARLIKYFDTWTTTDLK